VQCAFAPNRIETAEHLSKLTGQTTVVKEQVTTSGRGWSTNVSRSTHEVSRPLLTSDEAMRMKGARKNAQGMITQPGNMVIYVAGYPAIMGLQPLYFRDTELARRARIPAEAAQAKDAGTLLTPEALPRLPMKTPERTTAGGISPVPRRRLAASTSSARRHLRDGLKDPLRVALALPVGSRNRGDSHPS
jgi:type IV secretory pathway TraG/TraD family ATPase VirD4